MPETKQLGGIPFMNDVELSSLETIQNKLAASLVNWALDNNLEAKDWLEGGWSRAGDQLRIGLRLAGAPIQK